MVPEIEDLLYAGPDDVASAVVMIAIELCARAAALAFWWLP